MEDLIAIFIYFLVLNPALAVRTAVAAAAGGVLFAKLGFSWRNVEGRVGYVCRGCLGAIVLIVPYRHQQISACMYCMYVYNSLYCSCSCVDEAYLGCVFFY